MPKGNRLHSHSSSIAAYRLFVLGVLISFSGWVFEIVGRYLVYNDLSDRGFLTLPLCPIYGISVVSVYLLIGTPSNLHGIIGASIRKTKTWRKGVFYFLFVTLISTVAELVTGLGAKSAGITLWDYSERPLNLFGIICLSYSLMWGVLITVFMSLLWKPLYSLISRIKINILFPLSLTLVITIIADFTVSIIRTFSN